MKKQAMLKEEDTSRIILVLEDQGGEVMHWNYNELSPTIRSNMKHHEPIVLLGSNDEPKDDDGKKIF